MMNPELKAKLTEKAVVSWNNRHFGCDHVDYAKVFSIETQKPVTLFIFHYDWATMTEEREHESVELQNFEWNGNFDKRRAFVKDFISIEVKMFQKEQAKKKAERVKRDGQKNTIANLCPELAKLKFA